MKKNIAKYVQEENEALIQFKEDLKLTSKQKELIKMINQNKITVVTGPAGTAKTFCAAYAALKLMDKDYDNYQKIVITKPTEIVGDTALGFTPGTLEEKLGVYMENFQDVFEDIIEPQTLKQLVTSQEIQYKGSQFVRGRTLKNSIVIVDEFQSFDIKTLMAIVTRIGRNNCKMIFCGDIKQNDINRKYVAVNLFKQILEGIPDIGMFEFSKEDNMRSPIVTSILDNYDRLEAEGLITPNKKNT